MRKSKLIKVNKYPLNTYIEGIVFVFNGRISIRNPSKILLNKTSFLLQKNKFITLETPEKINLYDFLTQKYKIKDSIIHIRNIYHKNNVNISVVLLNQKISIPNYYWTNYLDFFILDFKASNKYDLYEHIKFNTSPLKNTHIQKTILSDTGCIELKLESIYNSLIGDIYVLF